MTRQISILIVEDEPLIRAFLDDVFHDAGCKVTLAASGDEAVVELLNGYDAILTDVEMPGTVDGIALAWQAYERSRDVGIIVMSGRLLPKKASLPPTARFIAKPAPADVLVDLVAELVK